MKLKKVLAGAVAAAMALTTMAVTSYAGELSWTNSNGVYTYTTEADPDTSDENYNGTAEYLMGVKLDAYLPSGATMADVRKINVTVSVTGGNCGGTKRKRVLSYSFVGGRSIKDGCRTGQNRCDYSGDRSCDTKKDSVDFDFT